MYTILKTARRVNISNLGGIGLTFAYLGDIMLNIESENFWSLKNGDIFIYYQAWRKPW